MAFPKDFWWGTGASSTQTEGAAPESDYFEWERQGKAPVSGEGNGFAKKYATDFQLYAKLGLTHHRLSIEWARIEPEEGKRDAAEVERYREMLEAARAAGINIWVCLHHFSLPRWFVAAGGFPDDAARQRYWRRHVDFIGATFGDLVFGWKPINEPGIYALLGWMLGTFPPGIKGRAQFGRALRGIHLANHEAWLGLRRGGRPVSTIMALSPIYPLTRAGDTADAARAATTLKIFDDIWWGSWIRALRDGVLAIGGMAEERIAEMAGSFDLIGFSYYSALGVYPDGNSGPYPPEGRVGPMGNVPWSAGLGVVLRRLGREFPGRPILICEHGIGTTDDARRVEFIGDSMGEVERALADGIDVRGFFHWTGVDNYEWSYGWDVPFGLFDRERIAKPSAELMARYARAARDETGNRPAGKHP